MSTGKPTDAIIAAATIEPGKKARVMTDGNRLTCALRRTSCSGASSGRRLLVRRGERMTVLGTYPAVGEHWLAFNDGKAKLTIKKHRSYVRLSLRPAWSANR